MGVFEDLELRVSRIEDLKLYRLDEMFLKLEAMHKEIAVLSRKIQIVEENLPAKVHSEVEALGRRVHNVETTWDISRIGILESNQQKIIDDCRAYLNDNLNTATVGWNDKIDSIIQAYNQQDEANKFYLAAMTKSLSTISLELQDIHDKKLEWQSLSWWKRLWFTIKGGPLAS